MTSKLLTIDPPANPSELVEALREDRGRYLHMLVVGDPWTYVIKDRDNNTLCTVDSADAETARADFPDCPTPLKPHGGVCSAWVLREELYNSDE